MLKEMIKIEVEKSKQGFQIVQRMEMDNGEMRYNKSGYMKASEVEGQLWELARLNRVIKVDKKNGFEEEMSKMDGLFDSMVKEICLVAGVKDWKEYVDKKMIEWVEGVWKYKIEGLGNEKEVNGNLMISSEGEVNGVGLSSKKSGSVVVVDEGSVKMKGVFEKEVVLNLIKELEGEMLRGYSLKGMIGNREVVLFRAK